MIPKLIGVGAAVFLVSFAKAAESPESEDDRLTLACSGSMVTADQAPPGGRIIANGIVDLVDMRVRGFGIGSAQIFSAGAEEVKFGDSPLKQTAAGYRVEGTIDRLSGATQILVRSAKDPSAVLIAMDLECKPTPEVGH